MREKLTLALETTLVERARNAAYARKEPLAQMVTRALESEVFELELTHGKPFRQRRHELPVGRPVTRKGDR